MSRDERETIQTLRPVHYMRGVLFSSLWVLYLYGVEMQLVFPSRDGNITLLSVGPGSTCISMEEIPAVSAR